MPSLFICFSDIYVICRPWTVRSDKNYARGPEYSKAQLFPIWTDQGRQIALLFFSLQYFFESIFCVEFQLKSRSVQISRTRAFAGHFGHKQRTVCRIYKA